MSTKTKNKKLQVTTPSIRTIYLGSGSAVKQRATYIQLPREFEQQSLYKDITNGAFIYDPFLQILSQNESRYNIITAPTEEDGMRAVQYLAEIHSVKDGYNSEDYSSDPDDFITDSSGAEYDLEIEAKELCPGCGEDESDDDCEDENGFCEDFFRIPIIPIGEVVSQDINPMNQASFGQFSYEMMNSKRPPKPWWVDCTEEAVCIIKNNDPMGIFWDTPELLDRSEIGCLKRFQNNRRVYIVVVGEAISKDDFSINTAMLEYTANCFHIDNKKDKIKDYYKLLLLQQASTHGFRFSNKIDVNLLADRLSTIDRQKPCAKFEKIMDYFVHINAHQTLNASDFRTMGLEKLINTESCGETSGEMDKKLHGMDAVKKQVKEIVEVMKYAKLREERGLGETEFHNVHLFVGAPGTAKTTVAKIMAKMMQEQGLIGGDRFISISGAQLKGAFVGQTAPKVHSLFEQYDAIFIDEAYSLTCGSDMEGGIDSYSQEALAQLAIELEEHGRNKLVIFAGYGGKNLSKKDNLMFKFLTANPGISSRIYSTIYFDSYTPKEMVSIVHHLANKANLVMNTDLDDKIANYFEGRRMERDFGNGREARAFLERCEASLASRITPLLKGDVVNATLNTILPEDIEAALVKMQEGHDNQKGEYGRKFGLV